MPRIGIIGGSGLYKMGGLSKISFKKIETPFGDPSDEYVLGELEGREVVFLPRHGRGHKIIPSELNYRANIYGMKSLDVAWIITVSTVGSFKPELKPTEIVLIDQFFDRTKQSKSNTFFGNGIVAHIPFAKPICEDLRRILLEVGKKIGAPVHDGGTYVNMEGPAFSTLAESQIYKSWGMDVIGMTQMNEARLAREAEICYATMAMVTDYDCWWEEETGETVSIEMIIKNLNINAETAQELIRGAIKAVPVHHECSCANVLASSIITDKSLWPQETVRKLESILKKYL